MVFVSHPLIKPEQIESKLYQEVLAARTLEKGNTLIVAPTALGKTIIAILVAAEILKRGQKVLFLSPTKPLAVQHGASMKKFLNIDENQIIVLTGALGREKRIQSLGNALVVSATPQAIQNDIVLGQFPIQDFGLVIFDECHKAIGNYSYVFIAEQYMRNCKSPLILGLTASPGSDDEKIQSICRNLFIKNVEVKTHNDVDVKDYVNPINVKWVRFDLPEKFLEAKKLLEKFQKNQTDSLKEMGFGLGKKYLSKKDMLMLQSQVRRDIILKGKTMPSLYGAAMKIASLIKVSYALELLETQGIEALNAYFDKIYGESKGSKPLKSVKQLVSDPNIVKAREIAKELLDKKMVHPKIEVLKKIILEQFKNNPESKIIVFNHYRENIRALENHLADIEIIRAKRFVGQASKGDDKGLTQKEQSEIINDLKSGKYNCLLASSVAEEGLDIPEVDLVVFYEPVPSEIRYIQRRGRTGRKSEGNVVILMARNTRDEAFYYSSKSKERKMQEALKQLKKPEAIPEKIASNDKQTTLLGFVQNEKKVTIFIDSREQASSIVAELQKFDVEIKIKQLDVGDFILSNDVVVERKTIEDFLNSVIDGRLFNQLTLMSSTYSAPLIILEGKPEELYTTRNIHENAIRGILASIALNYRIPILFTSGVEETAKLIFLIAKREQLGTEKEIRLRFGRKGLTIQEQQQFILEGFPMVGPSLAKALLKKFGTIRAIVCATIKELQEVENMGPIKAKKIHEILNAYYNQENNDL